MRLSQKTNWADADGTVTDVTESPTRGGTMYGVSYNYKVGEHWYGGYFTGYSAYRKGDSISVRYDPADPDSNEYTVAASRSKLWGAITIAVLIALFILIKAC
jgi:hypothetical protein